MFIPLYTQTYFIATNFSFNRFFLTSGKAEHDFIDKSLVYVLPGHIPRIYLDFSAFDDGEPCYTLSDSKLISTTSSMIVLPRPYHTRPV